jgi:hypothetical protein
MLSLTADRLEAFEVPRCNWAMMATTVCGPYARAPVFGGGAPGLFVDFR